MPVIESLYKPPFLYRNRHLATVIPSIYRKVSAKYTRERISLLDGDFLDLDWLKSGKNRLAILSHGLEGNSNRHYITATANKLHEQGWDVLAWNCRSCSGEMNLMPRLYSHIDAPDLDEVINHALDAGNYEEISLIGFSMGGAITLNYLTKMLEQRQPQIKSAVAVSAPVDVGASAKKLEKRNNSFYRKRFMKKMIDRAIRKEKQFPGLVDVKDAENITTFKEYDVRFTAPLNHCKSPDEFYEKAATAHVLDKIDIPTLMLIARDDPFMPDSCYPFEAAKINSNLYLEVPAHGGHVGFPKRRISESYMEERILEFIS